jgi:hypothetical protein
MSASVCDVPRSGESPGKAGTPAIPSCLTSGDQLARGEIRVTAMTLRIRV